MKIILQENDTMLRDMLVIYLDNCAGNIEVLQAFNSEQSIKFLKENSDIGLIFSEYMEEEVGQETFNFTQKNGFNIPQVFLTSDPRAKSHSDVSDFLNANPNNKIVEKPVRIKEFREIVQSIQEPQETTPESVMEEKYEKIRISYFLRFNKVLCDVFVKLSADKYVRIITKGDTYGRGDILKYKEKEIQFLYILTEDYETFCVTFAKTPFLIQDKKLPKEQIEEAVLSTIDIVKDLVQTIGLDKSVTGLIDEAIYQIDRELDDNKTLKNLLLRQRNKKDYLSDHSYMIGYIASSICLNIEWEQSEIRHKLSFASILHDILLDDPNEAYDLDLNNTDEMDKDRLKKLKKHPEDTVALFENCNNLPPNIDDIVGNHHENPEKTGYPRGVGALHISQLSGIFNVAQAFVHELYRTNFAPDKTDEILEGIHKRFSTGNYKEGVKGLLVNFPKSSVAKLIKS